MINLLTTVNLFVRIMQTLIHSVYLMKNVYFSETLSPKKHGQLNLYGLLKWLSWKWTLSNDQIYSNRKSNKKYIPQLYFYEGSVVSRVWSENHGKLLESMVKYGQFPLSITYF